MQPDLVLRAQAGDHDAFEAIAVAMAPSLYRTACLVLRDDELARDATQDALVSAWLDIRALRDPGRLQAWLHRLLVRACFKEADRSRRRRVLELRVDVIPAAADHPGDGGLAARDLIARGFRRLSADQRAVLVLHHYLGYPDAEAAGVLGIAAGTYKSRLHRANAALRAAIEADERSGRAVVESIA
jgi:RNA polymerase sigma-70 factor (ECF subfamily)